MLGVDAAEESVGVDHGSALRIMLGEHIVEGRVPATLVAVRPQNHCRVVDVAVDHLLHQSAADSVL